MFLIVAHTESGGRRDANLTLSYAGRTRSARCWCPPSTSGKRLVALGLGEEQLQDANRPTSPVNARAQIIAFGKPEVVEPKPASRPPPLPRKAHHQQRRSADCPALRKARKARHQNGPKGRRAVFKPSLPAMAGLILGLATMSTIPARADGLKDEMAPTGKLRVAIAISPAGGAFWSTRTGSGYAGVPVDLGREMAAQLGVPVEYVAHDNSGQIVDAVSKGTWDVTFLPKDPEREARMSFGPIYEVADATYIVKPNSTVTNLRASTSPASRSPRSTTPPPCAAPSRI